MVAALDQALTFRAVQGNVELRKVSLDRFVGLSRLQYLGQPLGQILPRRQLSELPLPRTVPPFWSSGSDETIPLELLHEPPYRVIAVSWTTAHHPNKPSPVFTFIDVLIGLRREAVLFSRAAWAQARWLGPGRCHSSSVHPGRSSLCSLGDDLGLRCLMAARESRKNPDPASPGRHCGPPGLRWSDRRDGWPGPPVPGYRPDRRFRR